MTPDIQLSNGEYFNFLDPDSADYGIREIAHALSHLCRYTGHTRSFYSVAQHSVLVSRLVPKEHALAGLLHDAHEAFVSDISAPLKTILPGYRDLEDRIQASVLKRFGLELPLDPCVKQADLRALATEKRDLMPHREGDEDVWGPVLSGVTAWSLRIKCLASEQAYVNFVIRYMELTGGVV